MKKYSILTSLLIAFLSATAFSQKPTPEVYVAPNAPKDKPIEVASEKTQQMDDAIRPSVEMAKKTYPKAKERFLQGLPPKHSFFITTRLHDSAGHFEQVFVAVREITGGQVKGTIASEIELVKGYRSGDSYTFPESDLLDWTITKPDGSEDGNFVGKFLDSYGAGHVVDEPTWRDQPATPERIGQRIEDAAVKYQANAPIPRVVFYDIGFPANEREYASLDGNAVVQLTALAQDRAELPLTRVYAKIDGKEVELVRIKQVLSEQPVNRSASAKTFGAFREDSLYLLPIKFRVAQGTLNADFAKNGLGFKLATFGTPVPEEVAKLATKTTSGAGPSAAALNEFVKREFPTFLN